MTKILVVLGEGGHTVQMLKLLDLLGPAHEYVYLMPRRDQTSESKIKITGRIHRASLPRGKNTGRLETLMRLALCSVQEFRILLKVRPTAILSAGAGIAVPISLFGRLLGVKIIHVESASRISTLSLTGKIMYRIAHLFFVQWEPLQDRYPKAIFAGRLL